MSWFAYSLIKCVYESPVDWEIPPYANLLLSVAAAADCPDESNNYEQQQMHIIKANEKTPILLAVDDPFTFLSSTKDTSEVV